MPGGATDLDMETEILSAYVFFYGEDFYLFIKFTNTRAPAMSGGALVHTGLQTCCTVCLSTASAQLYTAAHSSGMSSYTMCLGDAVSSLPLTGEGLAEAGTAFSSWGPCSTPGDLLLVLYGLHCVTLYGRVLLHMGCRLLREHPTQQAQVP